MTLYDKALDRSIFSTDGTYTEHYKNMCWKKLWYETEYSAVVFALNGYIKYRAYKCDYCSGWHLTTQNPNITKSTLGRIKSTKCKTRKKIYLMEHSAGCAATMKNVGYHRCNQCGYWHLEDNE